MKIDDIVQMAFSIQLHKNDFKYDAVKYNFKLNSNWNKQLQIFFNNNKFNFSDFTVYDKQQTKLRLIINYFINQKQIPMNCSDKDYEKMVQQLVEYQNEFVIFFKRIVNDMNNFNQDHIYKLYIKKEIPAYVFYYVIKNCQFQESGIANELIKTQFLQVHKMLMFIKVFDEPWIEDLCKKMSHHIRLNN